jgi:hypothetical protein
MPRPPPSIALTSERSRTMIRASSSNLIRFTQIGSSSARFCLRTQRPSAHLNPKVQHVNFPAVLASPTRAVPSNCNLCFVLGKRPELVSGTFRRRTGVTIPNISGPTSDWFLDSFQKQFGRPPDYIAAGSFATGVVWTECIRRAASLDDEKLRSTASDLDCNTLYSRFRIDARTGIQTDTAYCSSAGKEATK